MECCRTSDNARATVPTLVNGFVTPPEAPGLGVEVREEAFRNGDAAVERSPRCKKYGQWEALEKRGDLSAPTCASCHGNHGATPPQVSSIANVCGTCHVLFEELYKKSPHEPVFAAMGAGGCVACHGNHGIEDAIDSDARGDGVGVFAVSRRAIQRRCAGSRDGALDRRPSARSARFDDTSGQSQHERVFRSAVCGRKTRACASASFLPR